MTIEQSNLTKEIIQWSLDYLSLHGPKLKNNSPEIIQNTPWSYVIRFETTEGCIYLKYTPEQLALEATILQTLDKEFQAPVPKVVAHNAKLNCFLMKDAGNSLRSLLKQQFDEDLFCKAIDQFTSLQCVVAERIDVFFTIGVPDWRLDKLPGLFNKLISKRNLLMADGLTEMEISTLESLLPKVSQLCEKLASYSIKPTMVQPDFSDNNTLIDKISQTLTIIDLGKIVISHPFFSA